MGDRGRRYRWFNRTRLGRALGVVALLALAACGDDRAASDGEGGTATPTLDPERYVHKVARALRHGRDLGPDEELAPLLAMTPDQLVEHFMADPGFEDTALDFSLFHLGLRPDQLRGPDGVLVAEATNSRRAVTAARALRDGGDFLALLDLEQPLRVRKIDPPFPIEPGDELLPAGELRARLLERAVAEADRLIALAEAGSTTGEICGEAFAGAAYLIGFPIFSGFVAQELGQALIVDLNWYIPFLAACVAPDPATDLVPVLVTLRGKLPGLLTFMDEVEASSRPPRSLDDLTEIDPAALDLASGEASLEQLTFWTLLLNSSTNRDRRRAAYVLDRFFCDDLTPIDAALPEGHGGDRHASEPACAACHYKLDPMAGFFRDRGIVGVDFAGADQIIFDDMATGDRADYVAGWAAPPASGRTWDVGYVRSALDPGLNVYGESFEDLFAILRQVPETKACLVRRAFEYFNGEAQLVDPGYLADLTARFLEEVERDGSGVAFRAVMRRILTGATFRADDPRSDVDLPAGVDPEARPPCGIAFVLQRNCAGCHSGAGARGGLDLTGWTEDAAGVATFPHRDDGGAQVDAAATLERIRERIATIDPERAMPLGRSMAAADREAIYLWIEERLDQIGGAP